MHWTGFHLINTAAASYVPRRPDTATDLNRHNGIRSAAEGAAASVHLATLDADGPSGILRGHLWTAEGPSDTYGPPPLVSVGAGSGGVRGGGIR
jgi:hypothetical protein